MSRVLVIAEVGNNHEGSLARAEEMIGRAAEAGADVVKFQTIVPERLVAASEAARIARLESFRFSYAQFERLARTAADTGIEFCSTPFDIESARFLDGIQARFKIASGDNNFFPLIDAVAAFHKPVIVSTGLADIPLLENVRQRVHAAWRAAGVAPGLTFLHCVASYPVPAEQANLGAIPSLRARFPDVAVGYSDHTLGIDAAVYAVAAGAIVVEKHFTLDKNQSDFRDHQLSADPGDLRRMVDAIRAVEVLLGTGDKSPQPCEHDLQTGARRSIAAAVDIAAGTVVGPEHLTWLRPGTGLPPGAEAEVIGKRTLAPIARGELLDVSMLAERG